MVSSSSGSTGGDSQDGDDSSDVGGASGGGATGRGASGGGASGGRASGGGALPKLTCNVMEQKELPDGLKDEPCGKAVEDGHAGLCL